LAKGADEGAPHSFRVAKAGRHSVILPMFPAKSLGMPIEKSLVPATSDVNLKRALKI
jgi:hypothetical protein